MDCHNVLRKFPTLIVREYQSRTWVYSSWPSVLKHQGNALWSLLIVWQGVFYHLMRLHSSFRLPKKETLLVGKLWTTTMWLHNFSLVTCYNCDLPCFIIRQNVETHGHVGVREVEDNIPSLRAHSHNTAGLLSPAAFIGVWGAQDLMGGIKIQNRKFLSKQQTFPDWW